MEPGTIPFAIIIWFCGLIFITIGIYALKRKTPMHFWSGTTVKAEEISDVRAYNRANGIMWFIYGGILILSGALAFLNPRLATIMLVLLSLPGIIILIIVYGRIYNRYKV